MKKKIHSLLFRLGSLFLLLPVIASSCLFEDPELTADGEEGIDPTEVNVMTELTLDMHLDALELNKDRAGRSKSRAAEQSQYRHCFVVTAYEGKQVAARQVIYEDVQPDQTTLSLPISLKLHARKYQLVIWADYEQKVNDAYQSFYDSKDMERILRGESYKANSVYYDAFYGTTPLDLTAYRDQWNVKVPVDIKMIRPLARYDLIATDVALFQERIKKGEIKGASFTINVKYNYYLTTGFNALTGKVKNPLMYIQYSKSFPLPAAGTEESNIGFDYVFVNGEGSFVSLTIEVANEKGAVVARSRNVKVPYEQGYTTTARGKFLTSNPNPGIDIDTDFDDDINVDLDKL